MVIDTMDGEEPLFSLSTYACPVCGFTVPELEPRLFLSFNAPYLVLSRLVDGLGVKLRWI